MSTSHLRTASSQAVIAAIRSSTGRSHVAVKSGRRWAFVTVARQSGAGGPEYAEEAGARLNAAVATSRATRRSMGGIGAGVAEGEDVPEWKFYDKQLIEKVAHDYGLSAAVVTGIAERPRSALYELMEGMSVTHPKPSEEYIYGKVIETIRALAIMGHTVIVGRGGVYCTQDIAGGLHIQLVAPLAVRIRRTAEQHGISETEAARRVRLDDEARAAFYRRYWPKERLEPELFALTINTAVVSAAQTAEMVARLVRGVEAKASL